MRILEARNRIDGLIYSVEKTLKAVPGVKEASVNLATERARVRVGDDVSDAALVAAVAAAGYQATVAGDDAAPEHTQ